MSDQLRPHFAPDGTAEQSSNLDAIIAKLGMTEHMEGGFFVETDRDPHRVPNPLPKSAQSFHQENDTRSASTSIHYLLTPKAPLGAFHRNKARTVHTLHRGRGRYVIIHADEVASKECPGGYGEDSVSEEEELWIAKARVEVLTVGQDVLKGERLQWVVEGGKYKSSFLLLDVEGGRDSEGLLISETVVPGFEYVDHDFMGHERLDALVTKEQAEQLRWMVRKPG